MTPPPDDAWTTPEPPERPQRPERPESGAPDPDETQRPAYGSPASPSYGRYGQGQSTPVQQPSGQPGYPGYPGQAAWAPGPSAFTSGRLGTPVIVLSSLLTATLWVTALMSPSADRAVERAVANGTSLTDALASYSAVSLLSSPIWVAAWVVTSIWLGRAQRNALLLAPGGQRRSAVWAWLGWIIPIVSFWFPKQILDDTIRATTQPSQPSGSEGHPGASPARARLAGTGPYWAAWVGVNLLSGIELRLSQQAAPEDSIVPALSFLIAIVATIALLLWIPLVRRISAAQDQLASSSR